MAGRHAEHLLAMLMADELRRLTDGSVGIGRERLRTLVREHSLFERALLSIRASLAREHVDEDDVSLQRLSGLFRQSWRSWEMEHLWQTVDSLRSQVAALDEEARGRALPEKEVDERLSSIRRERDPLERRLQETIVALCRLTMPRDEASP